VKSVNGIALGTAPYTWDFWTGPDICTLDELDVAPSSYLFSSQYSSNVVDPNSNATFAATAAHLDATGAPQPISAIPGVYAWTTGWTVSTEIKNTIGNIAANAINAFPDAGSIPGSSVTVGVKSPTNGEGTLTPPPLRLPMTRSIIRQQKIIL